MSAARLWLWSAARLWLWSSAALLCGLAVSGAPLAASGRTAPSDHRLGSEYAVSHVTSLPDGSGRLSRARPVTGSWEQRTPTGYRDRVRLAADLRGKGLVSQRDGGHSEFRKSAGKVAPVHRDLLGRDSDSERQTMGHAIASETRVAQDNRRRGYGLPDSPQRNRGDKRIGGAVQSHYRGRIRSSPKLSYIRRRRPLGGGLGDSAPGQRVTAKGISRPVAPPTRPVSLSIPRPPAASSILHRPAAPPVSLRPATPPTRSPVRSALAPPPRLSKPTESIALKRGGSRPSEGSTEPGETAGLSFGSVIKRKLSTGIAVSQMGDRPVKRIEATSKPNRVTTETPASRSSINVNVYVGGSPRVTESPVSTAGKASVTISTGGPAPPVELLKLYQVGLLPNASEFFQRHESRPPGIERGRWQPNVRSGSGGGASSGTSGGGGGSTSGKVVFPLYVLPALPGASPAPDWPTIRPGPSRPCCTGRPGLVTPVAAPDRPVYPGGGSGLNPPPLPYAPTTRPVFRPSSNSYGPPTHPFKPPLSPCGTQQCPNTTPPAPTVTPPSVLPPSAPPPAASVTNLGSVDDDLVCVYLRSNGSALVLRADLASGSYNISDDHNQLRGWPGQLNSAREERPSTLPRPPYDVVLLDNQTTTVEQLLSRMRSRSARWKDAHRPATNIVCVVRRPETPPGDEDEKPGDKPEEEPEEPLKPGKPSEEPVTPTPKPTPTPTPTPTQVTTIIGAVDSFSDTIASAVDALGESAETQLQQTMVAADQTAVVIGSNMKNYIGTNIPGIALATTVGIPVFVAMLALLGAPPLLLSAMSVSSPLLLQGIAAIYNNLPN